MNTTYEVGKTYELRFASTIVKDGTQYIVATDGPNDFTIKPYDYQTEYSLIPSILSCYVRKIGFTGMPYFEQSKEAVLKDRYYQFGGTHTFTIDEIHLDTNSNKQFYVLSDEFGITHRYYPKDGEEVKKSGDQVSLVVKGIVPAQNGKNNARLDLDVKAPATAGAQLVYSTAKPVYPKKSGKNFGSEDAKKEFKSSIVYPAGDTLPDIDKQLGIICRTIAGFMNAGGGTLYIGVSDSGYICGIDGDYSHLNDGDEDFTYKENDDQYMLKITNRICSVLGRTAGTLIDMEIKEEDGMKYCVVDIKKASRPIWYEGNKLFVRMITTNRMLKNDEITQFVLDRVSKNSFVKQKQEEAPVAESAPATQAQSAAAPAAPAPAVQPAPAAVVVKKAKKVWRHITFYDNGDWSFQKNELQGPDVVINAEIPEDAKQKGLILILAYENGHVEATQLKEVLYGKNGLLPEGKRRGQGLCLANGKVVSVFCVKKKDMLLLTSEVAGEKYVKALDVDTLGIHDRMGKGNEIVREKGATLVDAVRILDDAGARISLKGSGIFIEKNQKYTKGGVKLTALAPNYQTFIDGFGATA